MSHLMHKSVRIGKYTIPALLLLALAIGTVAATVYVVLQFTAQATVQANPKVCFVQWPATKTNTFTEAFNIFPGAKTVDDNATHGVWNWDGTTHACAIQISGITNSGNLTEVKVEVVGTAGSVTWSGGSLPTGYTSFTASANTKYVIKIEVTAASGAVPTTTCAITVEMKVENP